MNKEYAEKELSKLLDIDVFITQSFDGLGNIYYNINFDKYCYFRGVNYNNLTLLKNDNNYYLIQLKDTYIKNTEIKIFTDLLNNIDNNINKIVDILIKAYKDKK